MRLRPVLIVAFFLGVAIECIAQNIDGIINAKEVERIEKVLSSDEMRGRKTFSPEIDKAADFISAEFKAAGLQVPGNNTGFKQEFALVRPEFISVKGEMDDKELDPKNIMVVTTKKELEIDEKSGYEITSLKAGLNLTREGSRLARSGKNLVVLVDESYANDFARLANLKRQMFSMPTSTVFILTNSIPKEFKVKAEHEIAEQKLANVVGIIPGKSRKDEYVIFSAHYDHVGIGKAENGDSIYNGANDDAAGTTAVITLAKYFKALGNNERTLVFAAFTAEEIGGFGSQYFSRQYDPAKVVAMFNIEMIGTESKWGRNSAFITGYEKTNMGEILQRNLEGSSFTFQPDPYPQQQLFYRSDNATLARLGVPAHTISTAKMENEPHYHKPSDEIETLDMQNMAEIIKAIALSSKTIISGKDSPTRVKVEDLR
jgi:hypothetical protein